jgi:hypothetical protein
VERSRGIEARLAGHGWVLPSVIGTEGYQS